VVQKSGTIGLPGAVRQRGARLGRTLCFGIRLHVVLRESEDEAWTAADALISRLDDATIDRAQAGFAQFDSEGQQRQLALHRQGNARSRKALEIAPNLWAGVGLVRHGAGTALVGDPEMIAARMHEYAALGIDTFLLSGYPHLEGAYRVAELLFPRLPRHSQSPKESLVPVEFIGMIATREQSEVVAPQRTACRSGVHRPLRAGARSGRLRARANRVWQRLGGGLGRGRRGERYPPLPFMANTLTTGRYLRARPTDRSAGYLV
jgi:hypothetical protein